MGDYNVTRDQWDEAKKVALKILQSGVFVTDADYNEMNRVLENKINRLTRALSMRTMTGVRVGNAYAWKSGGTNTISLNRGDAFVPRPGASGEFIHIFEDYDITKGGWTTPSGSDRTDWLYLDIYYDIVDSDDDVGLINPDVAEETMVDVRLKVDWKQQEGGSFPSPPTGHNYVKIVTIARLNGNDQITEDMCTFELKNIAPLCQDGSIELIGDLSVSEGIKIDGVDISEDLVRRDGTKSITGDLSVDAGIKIDGVDISQLDSDFSAFRADWREIYYSMGQEVSNDTNGGVPATDFQFSEDTATSYVTKIERIVHNHNHLRTIKCKVYLVHTTNSGRANLLVKDIDDNSIGSDEQRVAAIGDDGWYTLSVDISGTSETEFWVEFQLRRESNPCKITAKYVEIWGEY